MKDPYVSYGYLNLGVDIPTFDLSPEFGRTPPYDGALSVADKTRASKLLDENIVISLHDHPVRFPVDMRQTPEYNRTGRQHCLRGVSRIKDDSCF